ncbi:MAG: type II secretion system protein [Sedimentisphaerales bacterium]|jgi:Tfp pilus assembly protein FimT|nr:type II secretion system protein [Sedimentisphaerales bacterium]HNY79076.1 type II secretion system protein [Sedimentisphaerales bacterium]HOC64432.1 type II secretion system protein [Sedimentisphaerales bacterium]HOH65132.1 type II secretion system protein [Sedimentisphaerales bacterium]HPY51058.1 type II secretion system protein [Sedimentisphaerales bacterium]
MRTCSARIADRPWAEPDSPVVRRSARPRIGAFSLIELIVVLSMLALFVLMAQVNLFGTLRRSTFKAQVQSFVSAMQMAASTAAETGRRYEVIVDVTEQTYLLRQISSSNLAEVLDEEIIVDGQFGDSCRVSYVEFDDGTYANEGQAKFRVGHAGWQYGGKVVFLDEGEQAHTVAVGRLVPIVQVLEGDAELMRPKAKDEVSSF